METTAVKPYNVSYQAHPYHMVENSPWPLYISFALLNMAISGALYFWGYQNLFNDTGATIVILSALCVSLIMWQWFRDVVIEGTMLGDHTSKVKESMTIGFALFVVSEVFFFMSIFWAYLHSSLSPTVEIGSYWPPRGIDPISPFELPLLNTLLLLSSGAALTYGHHALLNTVRKPAILALMITLFLAVTFSACQGVEYHNAQFTFSDGVFGSTFYIATGFHAIHVIVGTIFLIVGCVRLINYHFTTDHHVGYESAILYWHFVDVVWLGLYMLVYWWGS